MTLLLYGIAQCDPEALSDGVGLDSRPLAAIGGQGLVALVSEHEQPPVLSQDALWSYEQVLEEQMSRHPLLPARFGSVFEGPEPIESALRGRREEIEARLALVTGAVELAVRATLRQTDTGQTSTGQNPVPAERGSGRAYLLERVRRSQDAGELTATLKSRLDPLARASRYSPLPRPGTLLTAAYLVEHDGVDEFAGRVGALQGQLDPVDLTCTGPWPPYSFAGEGQDG